MAEISSKRVVARYKGAGSIGDPKALLAKFEDMVIKKTIPQAKIDQAKRVLSAKGTDQTKTEISEAMDLAYSAHFMFEKSLTLELVGRELFLSILQTYSLPQALRKKIEISSRAYSKPIKHRVKSLGKR